MARRMKPRRTAGLVSWDTALTYRSPAIVGLRRNVDSRRRYSLILMIACVASNERSSCGDVPGIMTVDGIVIRMGERVTHSARSEANTPIERYGGFFEAQGLVVKDVGPGEVVVRLNHPRDDQRGGGGTSALNGGVIAYVFDGALGAAVTSLAVEQFGIDPRNESAFGEATISLTINYVQPALGSTFEAHGHAVRTGRTVAFAEGKLYDERGDVCATASGVWRLFLRS